MPTLPCIESPVYICGHLSPRTPSSADLRVQPAVVPHLGKDLRVESIACLGARFCSLPGVA